MEIGGKNFRTDDPVDEEDMETVGMLLVGKALDTSDLDPDSITAATERNSYDEMTTYLP